MKAGIARRNFLGMSTYLCKGNKPPIYFLGGGSMYVDRDFIARVRINKDGLREPQDLFQHMKGVAVLARGFAAPFCAGDWSEFMGYLHDLGKFTEGWQRAIRVDTGYELGSFAETNEGKGHHSTVGAVFAMNAQKPEWYRKVLAYVVAGHHAGLPDCEPGGRGACLLTRIFGEDPSAGIDPKQLDFLNILNKTPQIKDFMSSLSFPSSSPLALRRTLEAPCREAMHLWIRMLFSCVVDADFLDTERFMSPEKFAARGAYSDLGELKRKLDRFMHEKSVSAKPCIVNDLRVKVLKACREKALLPPGFFTLSVPTGAGKTLASMVFALDHALAHGKRRVVVGIPYTSIIEQTAKVYKYGRDTVDETALESPLFGEQNVVEHHSNLDPEQETQYGRLAAENWDAPIIVTTNVQLFESLSAARTSACRKLHNIVGSVIILDEAQMLPTPYLLSILANLRHLVEYFGVTVLFCTATQPTFVGKIGEGTASFPGIESAVEIYDSERPELYTSLERVVFHLPGRDKCYTEWQPLAEEMTEFKRVLCVVNTRKSAKDLHALMPEGTLHLSGLMCAEDRSDTIAKVKERLSEANECVRVVSTQLVEAGVDIDFPVVYRAFAGIDSLIQSAGRCNREGRMQEPGRVIIFNSPIPCPRGLLAKGEESARLILEGQSSFQLSDELFRRYFREFYGKLRDFDEPQMKKRMLSPGADFSYQFRSFASNYHLIDDQAQRSILVPYHSDRTGKDSAPLIQELEKRIDWELVRKLQRFTVSVPENTYRNMWKDGLLRLVGEGAHVTLSSPASYKPGKGLNLEGDLYQEALIV